MARKLKANGGDGENVVETGGNLSKLKGDVKQGADRIIKLKAERSSINTKINEIKSGLVSKGVSKRAFNRALQDYETQMDENDGGERRRSDDQAYWIAREAMGLGPQPDMFEAPAGDGAAEAQPSA